MLNVFTYIIALTVAFAAGPASAQFAAAGDPTPQGTPAFVAAPSGVCEQIFAHYRSPEALEAKAFAQTPDGKHCGANFNTKDNVNSAKPFTAATWDGVKEQALRNCGSPKRACVIVMTNSRAWTTFVPYEEWTAKSREARPLIQDNATVLDRDPRFDGDYVGKVTTVNPKTGKQYTGEFVGRAVQGVLEGTISGDGFASKPRIKLNILAGDKAAVSGTMFGSQTNYAVQGQITDNVPGDPVKGQTLRATISPLEQGQFPSGTLEAQRKG